MTSEFSRVVNAASMGVLTFLLVAGVLACVYFFLGYMTGVLGGPSSSAPAWWEGVYLLLPLPLLVTALWVSRRVVRKFLRP